MGNCQNQFHNVPEIQLQWKDKQRIENSMINRTHMRIQPKTTQQIKIGVLKTQYINKPIDGKSLYDTLSIKMDNVFKIQPKLKEEVQFKDDHHDELQQLDLNFYYSLGLTEYQYQQIPIKDKIQFENLQINENKDRFGVKYIGQWKRGQLHGNGVLTSNTRKYIGQFKNGLKHYHGRQITKYQVYQGQFKDGRRKGLGKRYTMQLTQEGTFDQLLIQGEIRYKNGNHYHGQLKNGKYDGDKSQYSNIQMGILSYKGGFVNGKMSGKGDLVYTNGRRYIGQFLDGCKHGKGKFYWDINQSIYYEGGYKYDQKHGNGKMVQPDKIISGTFIDGALHGTAHQQNRKNQQQTIKHFHQGQQIEISQQSIIGDGLPQHWQ